MFIKEEEIKRFREKIANANGVLELAKKLNASNVFTGEDNHIDTILYVDQLVLEPKGEAAFLDCRKKLRQVFGTYSDKLSSIDKPYDGCYLVRYHTNIPLLNIWVKYGRAEDLPASLTHNGKCYFKKVRRTEEKFVCDNK